MTSPWKVTLLLCDWAEEIGGKLYIMGGGWSRLFYAQPATMALAIKVYVPWDQANRRHSLLVYLNTEDGAPVVSGPPGEEAGPVRIEGNFEVGRPSGLRPGSDIDAPLVVRFQNLILEEGRYNWVVEINQEEAARVSFDVIPQIPSLQQMPGGGG